MRWGERLRIEHGDAQGMLAILFLHPITAIPRYLSVQSHATPSMFQQSLQPMQQLIQQPLLQIFFQAASAAESDSQPTMQH